MKKPATKKTPPRAPGRTGPLAAAMTKICGSATTKKKTRQRAGKTVPARRGTAKTQDSEIEQPKADAAREDEVAHKRAAARKAAAAKKKVAAVEARKAR